MALNVLISAFFRLVLFGYGVLILGSQHNIFPAWSYTAGYFVYIFVFILCKKKNTELYTFTRLLNDYALIAFTLHGKSHNFFNHCFIMLPIINSSNYSGKYGIFASLRLYLIAALAMLAFYNFNFNKSWILSFGAFWTLSLLSKGREFIKDLQLIISNPVSLVSVNQLSYHSANKRQILNDIIAEFNSNSILRLSGLEVKSVACFKINENGTYIVSSSYLVKKFSIQNLQSFSDFDSSLSQNFSNISISINETDKKKESSFFTGIKKNSNGYLYYVEFVTPPLSFLLPYARKIFLFTFDNLSKVYEIENSLKQRRLRLVKDLKEQALYIEKSTNNIHFINNKLSPILEYFTLRNDIQSGVITADAKVAQIFNELEVRSKRNIQMIATRSTKQLDKQLNPFYNRNPELLSTDQLWASISSAWLEAGLSSDNLFISGGDESLHAKQVYLQLDYFEVVIDEIIVNLLKYGQLKRECIASVKEDYVLLLFINDVEKGQLDKIKLLSTQFNGDQVSEMLKRTSHGMAMMKSYLLHLNIDSNILFADEEYNLILRIDFKQHENPSI